MQVGIDLGQLLLQVAILAEVEFLVIVLRSGELVGGQDVRLDDVPEFLGLAFAAGQGELLLLVVVVEDDAQVLAAAGALAGIGRTPERLQQFLE